MRVLLMDSHPGAGRAAADELLAAGHEVVRCRDPHQPSEPCTAFSGACPLDDSTIDVALDVRATAVPGPTPGEHGVVCAHRKGVPVVLAGDVGMHPFGHLADVAATDGADLTHAAGEAIALVRAREEDRLGAAASEACGMPVSAQLRGDDLTLIVRCPPGVPAEAATVRALAGVRDAGSGARRIRVETAPGPT